MKQQVARFSPHQNGKVFGVLMALGALVVAVPFFAAISAIAPAGAANAFPATMILIMPVVYLVFGYLSIAAGCLMYNIMFKYLGGIEFEAQSKAGDPVMGGCTDGDPW